MQDLTTDGLFSMRLVTRMTGLSSDTIRAWERRYAAVTPERTAGNTRRFSSRDVRRLILLRRATERGHTIKNIATLSETELERLLAHEAELHDRGTEPAADAEPSPSLDHLVDDYLSAVVKLDERRARGQLSRAAAVLERDAFLYRVVLPLLRRTGDGWCAGELSPVHEHLITAHVRGLLDNLLRLSPAQPGAPRVMVTTPPGHLHEFGALMGALLAASRGLDTIYLGPDLPYPDIRLGAETSRADVLLLALMGDMEDQALVELGRNVGQLGEELAVWVGLPPDHRARGQVETVRYFVRFEDLDAALTDLAARSRR